MKKSYLILAIVSIITLILFSCSKSTTEPEIDYTQPVQTIPTVGNGNENNPYQIATLGNLYWISQNHDKWNCHFIQTADIDASYTKTWYEGQGWVAIGFYLDEDNDNPFTGVYNGNNYEIDGLFINRPDSNYQGLFGRTDGAFIHNIGITNVDITGNNRVGGLVGNNRSGSIIANSYSTGNVSGYWCVGGLVGGNWSANLFNSYSNADVASTTDNVGGLAGWNGSSTIENCYSTGGVIGASGDIGGMIGVSVQSVINNSYWNFETSGQDISAGGEKRSTSEMNYPYNENTYVDWCFDTIWSVDLNNINNGYPFLRK